MGTSSGLHTWKRLLVLSSLAWGGLRGFAGEFHLDSAGAKYGFGSGLSSSDFHEVAAFADWVLPWEWGLGKTGSFIRNWTLTAGWLTDFEQGAFLGSAGPMLVVGRGTFPVTLVAGFLPTYISRWEFDSKNLGIPFQVTSCVGLDWNGLRRLRLSYCYQHMSDLALATPNPGLNLHVFVVSYPF